MRFRSLFAFVKAWTIVLYQIIRSNTKYSIIAVVVFVAAIYLLTFHTGSSIDIGDLVCEKNGAMLGYAENIHGDKVQIRIHTHENGDWSFAQGSTPGRDYDTMVWRSSIDVNLCR